jgi:hypothetical protein
MAADKQPKNLNVTYIGSAQFSFADGAITPAAAQAIGFRDFGNLKAFSTQSKTETKPHKGSYDGIKRRDKTFVTETEVGYQLDSDELGSDNLAFFVYGSQGGALTQVARTAAAADALSSPVAGRWYDLLIGGARVRELTAVAITSTTAVVEDVNYVIDYDSGRIRFITTPPGTITSILLTAPALTSTAAIKTVKPGTTPIRRGMGRLKVYDSDGLIRLDHPDFYCELTPNGSVSFGDDAASGKVDVNIIQKIGTLIVYES